MTNREKKKLIAIYTRCIDAMSFKYTTKHYQNIIRKRIARLKEA